MRNFLLGVFVASAVWLAWHGHAQLAVSVFGLSKHSQSGYCEANPGLALNYSLSRDVRLLAGRYENSKCHWSNALGIVYCGMRFGDVCFGSGLVRLTGYSAKALYVPLPTASYERPKYAVDFVGGTDGKLWVVGVGLRFPL